MLGVLAPTRSFQSKSRRTQLECKCLRTFRVLQYVHDSEWLWNAVGHVLFNVCALILLIKMSNTHENALRCVAAASDHRGEPDRQPQRLPRDFGADPLSTAVFQATRCRGAAGC